MFNSTGNLGNGTTEIDTKSHSRYIFSFLVFFKDQNNSVGVKRNTESCIKGLVFFSTVKTLAKF